MKSTPTITLPRTIEGSHALIEQLARTVGEQTSRIDELEAKNRDLVTKLAEEMQRLFRQKSERYIEHPDQLRLDLGDTDDAADAAEGLAQAVQEAEIVVPEHRRRKKKPRNETLPKNLERRIVELPASEDDRVCPDHGERKQIGYDTTETLEYIPSVLQILETRIPKYACCGHPECGVASPERPVGLVEGNRYDSSVATQIITAKYGFHLPVYRQQDLFAGSGWAPARSTLLNILVACAALVRPVVEYFKQVVLGSGLVGTDDTRVTLLLPEAIPTPDPDDPRSQRAHEVFSEAVKEGRRSVSGRMWAYRGITVALNVFDFSVSRHRDGPVDVLAGYRGVLQADCYAGYEGIAVRSDGDIVRAACVAHARRKFFEARATYPLLGAQVLALFQQLYDIEDRGAVLDHAARLELRRTEATAVWTALHEWRSSQAVQNVLGSSNFGKALGYLGNHWKQLQVYLSDGRLPIDNNAVEQLMKQVAVGRKNWLFIGSVAAGQRAADFLTLVSSALRNDLDPWRYIKDVLDRRLAGDTDYEAMRPDLWKQAHPEAIREYRAVERRDRADRKQYRRAVRRAHAKS